MAKQSVGKYRNELIHKMLNNIIKTANAIKTMLSLMVNEMDQLVEVIKKQEKD